MSDVRVRVSKKEGGREREAEQEKGDKSLRKNTCTLKQPILFCGGIILCLNTQKVPIAVF